jgi:hypothetical protein
MDGRIDRQRYTNTHLTLSNTYQRSYMDGRRHATAHRRLAGASEVAAGWVDDRKETHTD